ncbi:MAG: hypothetical protein CMH49_10165 [Myxococcales bacterium]|nr:hypothetical protein [Myxococcales bacterium]
MADQMQLRAAQRLARTIASDLLLYNRDRVEQGIREDRLFKLLESEIKEGRELYVSRVSAEIIETYTFLDRALVDVLIHSQAELECKIW